MEMTTDEARTKWCPFSFNKNYQNRERCINDSCMAWRWNGPALRAKEGKGPVIGPNYNLLMATMRAEDKEPDPNRRGHCGLAGDPIWK